MDMISWTTSSIVRTWPLWHGLLELAVLYPADYRGLTSGLRMPNIVLTALPKFPKFPGVVIGAFIIIVGTHRWLCQARECTSGFVTLKRHWLTDSRKVELERKVEFEHKNGFFER